MNQALIDFQAQAQATSELCDSLGSSLLDMDTRQTKPDWPNDRYGYAYLTRTELDKSLQDNIALLESVRRHISPLLARLTDFPGAILVCNGDGWLLDTLGDSAVVTALRDEGVDIGVRLFHGVAASLDELPVTVARDGNAPSISSAQPLAAWATAAVPVQLGSGAFIGSIVFALQQPEVPKWVQPLIHSVSISIANHVQMEEMRQDLARLHHGLLSQLDYHVISLDPAQNVVEERHPVPLPKSSCEVMRIITQRGECSDCELTIDNKTYLVDVRAMRDRTGKLRCTLGLFRDISQRKEYEMRLRDVERLSTLTTLSAGIAHEIRNPLTTARGFLQLFAERSSSAEDKRFLALTIEELDRVQQLLTDFMGIARPHHADTKYQRVSLNDLVGDVVNFMIPEARLKSVVLEANMRRRAVEIQADANRMKQVVINVVQNAVHACRDGGRVSLALFEQGSEAVLQVGDTGCGIADVSKLFRPFYTTKASGTGLGLLVSKNIIEEHSGRISVQSAPDIGTTVTIRLPIVAAPTAI